MYRDPTYGEYTIAIQPQARYGLPHPSYEDWCHQRRAQHEARRRQLLNELNIENQIATYRRANPLPPNYAVRLGDGALALSAMSALRPAAAATTIDILGPIGLLPGETSAATVLPQIDAAERLRHLIKLRVGSPGGDLMETVVIASALSMHPYGVEADIIGEASSAASFLVMFASRIRIVDTGLMMIHRASALTIGDADEHRHAAGTLDRADREILLPAYRRTRRSDADILAAMSVETWFTGAEAVAWGLADEVVRVSSEPVDEPTVAQRRTDARTRWTAWAQTRHAIQRNRIRAARAGAVLL